MLGILGFITGLAPAIAQIAGQIMDLQRAKISASTEVQKAEFNKQIEDLHDKRQVLVAEAGSRINAIMRFIIAIGPAAYLTKIFVWDKVIGSIVGCAGVNSEYCRIAFNTDTLDANLWWVALGVVGFYFLTSKKWN